MTKEQIIKTLNDFVPFSEDDPINQNESFLYTLMDEWKKTDKKGEVTPSIFKLMEKYPHADFGSPGPLVHALEATGKNVYEGQLHVSLLRKPTPLTLWMYNRLINAVTDPKLIEANLQRLKLYAKHPFADAETKKTAESFIDYQQTRLKTAR